MSFGSTKQQFIIWMDSQDNVSVWPNALVATELRCANAMVIVASPIIVCCAGHHIFTARHQPTCRHLAGPGGRSTWTSSWPTFSHHHYVMNDSGKVSMLMPLLSFTTRLFVSCWMTKPQSSTSLAVVGRRQLGSTTTVIKLSEHCILQRKLLVKLDHCRTSICLLWLCGTFSNDSTSNCFARSVLPSGPHVPPLSSRSPEAFGGPAMSCLAVGIHRHLQISARRTCTVFFDDKVSEVRAATADGCMLRLFSAVTPADVVTFVRASDIYEYVCTSTACSTPADVLYGVPHSFCTLPMYCS